MAMALSALLKKKGFSWTKVVIAAFDALKGVVSALILTMPNFTMPFTMECDASSHGFGIVLIQYGHPIAFFSKPVAPHPVPSPHTSDNSLAWCMLSGTRNCTFGVVTSPSRPTIIASNIS
jgi:hypothetical protein